MNNKELITFAKNWCVSKKGHKIDVDNQSADCVDIPKKFMMDLGCTGNLSTGINAAKGYWTNTTDDILKHFVKIQPVPLAEWELFVQPGDIVVWDGTPKNSNGHTAVVYKTTERGFIVLEQDTYKQEGATMHEYKSNTHILGVLRYKTEDDDEEIIQNGLDDMYGVKTGLQNIPARVLDRPIADEPPKEKSVTNKVTDGVIKHTAPATLIIFAIHELFPDHIITNEETALVVGVSAAVWSSFVNIVERFLHIDIGINK